ncbi:hypothetical protein PF008_g25114 [Phytophthora fragariae]|uniref:Uncharacterized protein n=1 Tax=Phytophthora fragariae TaxID=53985 RepID=A0A6G0QLU4_9STRA|nr:hypothetical protein PF008_g25114 [Phytophthora fragariae]
MRVRVQPAAAVRGPLRAALALLSSASSRRLFARPRFLLPSAPNLRARVGHAHVEGQLQPVRYRHTRKQNNVRLCQVGPCQKQGLLPHGEMLVCKAHAVLLVEKDRYIDQDKAAEYAVDMSKPEISSRTQVCNFVGCNDDNVTHRYHGVFCSEHLPVIDDLRSKIMTAKCHGDEAVQIPLRYSEIFLRKFLDERHVQYYNELVVKNGFVAPIVHIQGDQIVGLSGGL